ncbi:MAG: MarR family transcriptional regulator, partial [Oscillospiraceae bacterium]|nr:MarR family transcriptional regulator [Oscillospiraceae bacterium]
MTRAQQEQLNYFFVHVFNQILIWEEQALGGTGTQDLSVKELHVLEAVNDLTAEGRNTMTQTAEALAIRVSSLTAAVNTLVRKGYLERGG